MTEKATRRDGKGAGGTGWLLPLLAANVLAFVGLWMRWPTVFYAGLATQEEFNNFAFDRGSCARASRAKGKRP